VTSSNPSGRSHDPQRRSPSWSEEVRAWGCAVGDVDCSIELTQSKPRTSHTDKKTVTESLHPSAVTMSSTPSPLSRPRTYPGGLTRPRPGVARWLEKVPSPVLSKRPRVEVCPLVTAMVRMPVAVEVAHRDLTPMHAGEPGVPVVYGTWLANPPCRR